MNANYRCSLAPADIFWETKILCAKTIPLPPMDVWAWIRADKRFQKT